MIIDFHTHTFPEKIAASAVKKLEERSHYTPVSHGMEAELLSQMDTYGCDISVIAPVATSIKQVSSINRNSRDTDRLITLGAMYPEFPDIKKEIAYLKEKGVKGVKLHSEYQNFRCDEKRMYPIYEELSAQGMFVLFHAGLDIGLPAPYGTCPDQTARVARDFPNLKIVAAHMGGFEMYDGVLEYLCGLENVWFDTALCAYNMPDDTFSKILSRHGSDRILMATDWPWRSVGDTIKWIEEKNLGNTTAEAILGGNARLLLNI